jgi:pimeloyl-ACP methyl ester carboxylesterase
MATLQRKRLHSMVLVSAVMRHVAVENQPPEQWEIMRKRHKLGDEQILALWKWRGMSDSSDDMNFTPPLLGAIEAATLIVHGDRDFLYPLEMAIDLYRAIPGSALWVVPNGGHGPVFLDAAPQFAETALRFLGS